MSTRRRQSSQYGNRRKSKKFDHFAIEEEDVHLKKKIYKLSVRESSKRTDTDVLVLSRLPS